MNARIGSHTLQTRRGRVAGTTGRTTDTGDSPMSATPQTSSRLRSLERMLAPSPLPRGAHKDQADELAVTARDSLLDAAKELDGTEPKAHTLCLAALAAVDELREELV